MCFLSMHSWMLMHELYSPARYFEGEAIVPKTVIAPAILPTASGLACIGVRGQDRPLHSSEAGRQSVLLLYA